MTDRMSSRRNLTRRWLGLQLVSLFTVTALLAGACASDEQAGEIVSDADSPPSSTSTDGDSDDSGDVGADVEEPAEEDADGDAATTTSTGAVDSTTTTSDDEPAELPGDLYNIGPRAGEPMVVVGVAHDDVLNFRTLPDASSPIRATVAPQATSPEVISMGEGRLLTGSAWWHVTVDGQELWANSRFLGTLGDTYDSFDELSSRLGGDLEDPSIEALVERLRAALSADGPEASATFVTDPDIGSGTQDVTVDLLGYGDDAIYGERIVLTVTDTTGSGSPGVRLTAAEATLICSRGVSGTFCV